MLSQPQLDPMGALIAEAKADDDVAALVGTRVRGMEPKGSSDTYEGDALGAGAYKAFVVLSPFDVPPHRSLPVTFAEYGVQCYGVTAQGAWAVWAALVKAFHKVGERVKDNGLGIYLSFVITGGSEDRDPDTQQPLVSGVIRVIATTTAVA